jgi:Capsule assembly protein Wzi
MLRPSTRPQPGCASAHGAAACALLLTLLAPPARAGPNLPSEDPAWESLRDALAQGLLGDPLGGVQALSADTMAALLSSAAPADSSGTRLSRTTAAHGAGPWLNPVSWVTVRAEAASVQARPYSTPVLPRDIAGAIDISCEHQEGRPCGDGAGGMVELDSAAGVGQWLTVATRVRAVAGDQGYSPALELDRAYLRLAWGPLSAQLGRDVFSLGPAVRSATAVSDDAAPQDGLRLQLSPVALPFAQWLKLSLFYFLDRARDPQTFHGTLIDGSRVQLDLFDRLQLGGTRLLQLGGDGAPDYGGLWGFVGEHFGRAGSGTEENNRLELDVSLRLPSLWGARFYYEVDYEDTNNPRVNSFLNDADHLFGFELRAVQLGPVRRLFFEIEKTSFISQEHGTFQTGMTSDGRTLGTPLGPDAISLWARADLVLPAKNGGNAVLSPWGEWLRESSDLMGVSNTYGVYLIQHGVYEHRQRLGVDYRTVSASGFSFSIGLFGERVANQAFVAGDGRLNGGVRLAVTARP